MLKTLMAFIGTLSISYAAHAVPYQIGGDDTHPSMKVSAFVKMMKEQGKLSEFIPVIDAQLKALIPDPSMRAVYEAQLAGLTTLSDYSFLDHFPIIPLMKIGLTRGSYGAMAAGKPDAQTATPAVIPQISGKSIDELLGNCDAHNTDPDPVAASLPLLSNGYFVNPNKSACDIDRSYKIAGILTSLGANNNSSLTYGANTVNSTSGLIAALVADGHLVKVLDERVYADFLSYNWGPTEIVWPAWLDTGIKLKNGRELIVPMGHSQYLMQITGPKINAEVTFFMGTDGTGFFPNVATRPNWTGGKIINEISSADNMPLVLASFDAASSYLTRTIKEISSFVTPKGLPDQGYGFLGVCNDSVAVLEAKTGTISSVTLPFPLLRDLSLSAQPAMNDGLDQVMVQLPKDGDIANPDRADFLRRAVAMTPFPLEQIKQYLGLKYSNLIGQALRETQQP